MSLCYKLKNTRIRVKGNCVSKKTTAFSGNQKAKNIIVAVGNFMIHHQDPFIRIPHEDSKDHKDPITMFNNE